jgi:hypothetical protein
MRDHPSSAETLELPTHEDVQELRTAIESLRDHVQIVWQAIDEVREVIEQVVGHEAAEFWNVEPPNGLPLGRYRPFAGYNPAEEWNNENGEAQECDDDNGELVEPAPVFDMGQVAQSVRRQQQMLLLDEPNGDQPPVERPEAKPITSQKEAESEAAAADGPVGSQVSHEEGVDTFEHDERPYSLDDWIAFRHEFADGQVGAAGIQREFRRMRSSKQHFVEQLVRTKSADQLRLMALQHGHYDARRNTKPQNAESVYRSCLTAFTLGESVCYQPLQGETYESAVERIVMGITDESLAKQREKRRQEREAQQKALTNPETLLEFATFMRERGSDELSDVQFALWDRLHADRIRADRHSRKQPDTVEQFQSAEIAGIEFRIIEGFHDREKCPLFIVQLTSRVERTTFNELKVKASQLGGWWSSFKKDAAGFQFRSRESAEKFAGLAEGDADRTDELAARKLRKMDNASERLNAVAASLEEKAAEVLAADDTKLKNTARRADMAASMRAQAYNDQADAKTLRSIAAALGRGGATYLDGIWNAAQVRTLEGILRRARRDRINEQLKEEGIDQQKHGWSQRYDELEQAPLSTADARHATFPKPYLYNGHLQQAFAQLANTPGVKQATAKMRKLVDSRPKGQDFVEFVNEYQIELLEDFLSRARASGCKVWWFDHCLDDYKRLTSAHIEDGHELRMALRELVPHLAHAACDDPVKKAEDELRGKDLPGFYPTPRPLIEQMLDAAEILPTHRVLEPSAGLGNIIECITNLN